MNDPKYMKNLFNVLKNETRLYILNTSVKKRYSLDQIQQKLRRAGHNQSRETLNQKYLKPLLGVGLISEIQDQYYATMLGNKIITILTDFPDFGNVLPAHSKCYEEKLLRKLLDGPTTFHEIEKLLTPSIASRIIKRLKGGKLVVTPKEREYVFFFRRKEIPTRRS